MSEQSKKLTPQILAMYLGCMVKFHRPTFYPTTFVIHVDDIKELNHVLLYEVIRANNLDIFKLILRKLEDMSEEEKRELCRVIDYPISSWRDVMNNRHGHYSSEMFSWLLSKSFDLFGLINSNEAIDAKTLIP